MDAHGAYAVAATAVSAAFALCTLERWIDRRKPHELAWTIALGLFAAASAAMWWGAATGWTEWSFRVFYALGAVVNVPVLALGTVLLLARPSTGRTVAVAVGLGAAMAFGMVVAAPLTGTLPAEGLPKGSEVFGALPRTLAVLGSGLGAAVLVGGAVWSAVALVRRRGPGRLVIANGLIALGTLILSAGGTLQARLGEVDAFAVSLVAGVSVIFAGFLTAGATTSTPRRMTAGRARGTRLASVTSGAQPDRVTSGRRRAG